MTIASSQGGLCPPQLIAGGFGNPPRVPNDDRVERRRALPAAAHRGRVWEPSQGFPYDDRVERRRALPAGAHRGRVWEPSQGSHLYCQVMSLAL